MGGGTTTDTTGTNTKASQLAKDLATSLIAVGGGIATLAAVPEPGSPVLFGVAVGVTIGAGAAYGAVAVLDALGY
ncbi:MAG: hypothetical protein R2831_12440 [Chitinophagaceae bacterium]